MVTVGSILSGTFRFARGNIPAILIWSGILFLHSLLAMALMQPVYSAQVAGLQSGGPAPSGGLSFLNALLTLLVYVVLWAAVIRGVLMPERGGLGYLRLGMDELRLLGCALILIISFYLLVSVGGAIVGLVFAFAAGGAGSPTSIVQMVIFGAIVVAILLAGGLGTRFSLAGPLTLLEGKIIIGPSWRLTRDHFWRLLGAYLVIVLLLGLIYAAPMMLRPGPSIASMFKLGDPGTQTAILRAQADNFTLSFKNVVIDAVIALVGGVALALHVGMLAVATSQLLSRGGDRHLNEVFE